VIGDEAITQCVRDIRKALNDDSQRLLRTVPERGVQQRSRPGRRRFSRVGCS
jgi:DNA-binding winged helix-turn-helix (wHTH) protein